MNVLDSTLEPLAFSYLSFGFLTVVNNLWTWVAVITAAVSIWRIRAAGCLRPELPPCNEPSSNGSDPVREAMASETVEERPQEAAVPAPVATMLVVGNGDADVDGVTKGKFTLYYYEDDSQCESDTSTVTEEWEEKESGKSKGGKSEWWESWEKLLRARMGESEWYMYQDLTELNGNVVRLWDSGLGSLRRESGYSCRLQLYGLVA